LKILKSLRKTSEHAPPRAKISAAQAQLQNNMIFQSKVKGKQKGVATTATLSTRARISAGTGLLFVARAG